ncbi:MAG: hypothetical protein H6774_04425 [Pseudomonadales bacterium]|nr:hypothetical protein [Pseudomonadales bacterium]
MLNTLRTRWQYMSMRKRIKALISGFFLLILMVTAVSALIVVQQNQENRQKASEIDGTTCSIASYAQTGTNLVPTTIFDPSEPIIFAITVEQTRGPLPIIVDDYLHDFLAAGYTISPPLYSPECTAPEFPHTDPFVYRCNWLTAIPGGSMTTYLQLAPPISPSPSLPGQTLTNQVELLPCETCGGLGRPASWTPTVSVNAAGISDPSCSTTITITEEPVTLGGQAYCIDQATGNKQYQQGVQIGERASEHWSVTTDANGRWSVTRPAAEINPDNYAIRPFGNSDFPYASDVMTTGVSGISCPDSNIEGPELTQNNTAVVERAAGSCGRALPLDTLDFNLGYCPANTTPGVQCDSVCTPPNTPASSEEIGAPITDECVQALGSEYACMPVGTEYRCRLIADPTNASCNIAPTPTYYDGWWQSRGGLVYSALALTNEVHQDANPLFGLLARSYIGSVNPNSSGIARVGSTIVTFGNAQPTQRVRSQQMASGSDALSPPSLTTTISTILANSSAARSLPSTLTQKPTDCTPLDGATVCTATGLLTIDGERWIVNPGEKLIIVVGGDVRFAGSRKQAIWLQDGGFFALIASGTITFGGELGSTDHQPGQPDVPQTDNYTAGGVYLAGHNIVIEQTSQDTDKQFVGNGVFAAGGNIQLQRSLAFDGNTHPASLFVYNPQLLLNAPDFFLEGSVEWQP